MRWLPCLFQMACHRERNNIWAISVAKIVLKNNTWSPAALFATATTKSHVENIPDLRLSACVSHDVTILSLILYSYSITRENTKVKLILKFTENYFSPL